MFTPVTSLTRFVFLEDGTYPLSSEQIKARHPNTSFPATLSEELLRGFGYFSVALVAPPAGDVVTEIAPTQRDDGGWEQAYEVRAFTPEEATVNLNKCKQELLNQLRIIRDASLNIGGAVQFGGDWGVQHIQMRDGDRANLVGLRVQSEASIVKGLTDITAIRTYENSIIPVSHEQMVDLSWKYMLGYKEIMGQTWMLEGQIYAAQSKQDLPQLPEIISSTPQELLR